MDKTEKSAISFFEWSLTYWVASCMVAGVLIGKFVPAVPKFLARFEYAKVSIPIAILIWLIKPFAMFGIAAFFFCIVFKPCLPCLLSTSLPSRYRGPGRNDRRIQLF